MRTTVGRAGRWARRSVAIGLVCAWSVLGATLGVTLGATPAAARAVTVVATEPRAEQTLDDAPGWVTIAFEADIDSSVAKVIVQGPDGDNVTTGSLIVEGTNVTSQLRDELPQGTYTVHYRVNSSDGDVEGGAFQFAYVTGSFSTLPDRKWSGSDNEPAILSGTDPNDTAPPGTEPTTTPPDVEVEKSDGGTETVDPGPTRSAETGSGGQEADEPTRPTVGPTVGPTDGPTDGADPSVENPTATTGPANRLPLIVGGAVLLIAIGAGAVALVLRGRGRG